MGFLSFLSRNSSHENKSLKSQAYHSTIAAVPPVRGRYPLAGNNSSEVLQRTARKLSGSHASSNGSEQWVPPPSFRRPRATSDARLNTSRAESDAELPPRPKSAGKNSRYTNGSGPPYLLSHPLRRPAAQDAADFVPPVPSLTNLRPKLGYVDILDAQSDLKPSNFRARILASGVRDYGEDVAERNMEGGALPSEATKPVVHELATGPSTRASSVRPKTASANRRNRAVYRTTAFSDDSDEGAPAPVVATGDQGKKKSAIRRRRSQKNMKRSGLTSPTTTSSRASSHARVTRSAPNTSQTNLGTIDARSHHRRSKTSDMEDHVASRRLSASNLPSKMSKPRSKPRPLSFNPPASSSNYDDGASPPNILRFKHHMTAHQNTSQPRLGNAASTVTARAQRRASSVDVNMTNFISRINTESHLWASSSDDDEEPYFPSRSLPTSRSASRHASRGALTGIYRSDARQDELSTSSTAPFEFERSRSRTRSLGGMNLPKRPQLYDISEHIPTRGSSLGPKSSSATLTTVMSNEHSSNAPFTRPQSQHTAATSVELYSGKSTSASDTSPSLKSGGRPPSSAYFTAMEEFGTPGLKHLSRSDWQMYGDSRRQSLQTSQLPSYNYITSDSSDTDSFVGTSPKNRLDGEALLFRASGYGNDGNDLPGLSDMLDGYDVDEPDWERHLTIPMNQDWYVGTRLQSPDANKRMRMPFLGSDSEPETTSVVSSSVNDAEFLSDVGEEQARAIKHMRLSAMSGLFPKLVGNAINAGRIYDEGAGVQQDSIRAGEEWVDVGTTMKLRKEMKRNQRMNEREQSRGRAPTVKDAGHGDE